MNTATGRGKQKQASKGRPVSIVKADRNNMYDRVTIQGQVKEQTKLGANAHIDKAANKYTGAKKYEQRVIVKIEPLRVI